MTIRSATIVAAALSALSPQLSPAQSVAGYRYTLEMDAGPGDRLTAVVQDAGDRARIDFVGARRRDDTYLLLLEGGHRMVAVHPAEREYSVVDDTTLERIVGRALHAVSAVGVVRFRLDDVTILPERLGAGEPVAGRPTRRFRLTQDYTVGVRALGLGGDDIHQSVVTDYWVDPGLKLVRNPLLELLATFETALAQQDSGFARMSAGARRALFAGFPLKVVVRHSSSDHDSSVRTLEVTSLERGTLDAAAFTVPAGFQRRHAGEFSLDL